MLHDQLYNFLHSTPRFLSPMRLISSFLNMLQNTVYGPEEPDVVDSEDKVEVAEHQSNPTDEDVFAVRAILVQLVPAELVIVILHAAQYWPCISAKNTKYTAVQADSRTRNNAAAYYLITPIIPTKHLHFKVEMVKFNLKSCDQGWGGDPNNYGTSLFLVTDSLILWRSLGTYNGSFTWFEAGIMRSVPDDSVPPIMLNQHVEDFDADAFSDSFAKEVVNPFEQGRRWELQYNMQVSSTVREHEVVWMRSDIVDDAAQASARAKGARTGRGFISALAPGDRIVLMARAQVHSFI